MAIHYFTEQFRSKREDKYQQKQQINIDNIVCQKNNNCDLRQKSKGVNQAYCLKSAGDGEVSGKSKRQKGR